MLWRNSDLQLSVVTSSFLTTIMNKNHSHSRCWDVYLVILRKRLSKYNILFYLMNSQWKHISLGPSLWKSFDKSNLLQSTTGFLSLFMWVWVNCFKTFQSVRVWLCMPLIPAPSPSTEVERSANLVTRASSRTAEARSHMIDRPSPLSQETEELMAFPWRWKR